jgi:ketosteroid isomerase-like protein
MAKSDDERRAETVALVSRMMNDFGHCMSTWLDNLHPDIAIELPQGPAVGLERITQGKAAATEMFRLASDLLDVKFTDVVIHPMADPDKVVTECIGIGYPNGRLYRQHYVTFQQFKDGKLFRYREYFDVDVAKDVVGDLLPNP